MCNDKNTKVLLLPFNFPSGQRIRAVEQFKITMECCTNFEFLQVICKAFCVIVLLAQQGPRSIDVLSLLRKHPQRSSVSILLLLQFMTWWNLQILNKTHLFLKSHLILLIYSFILHKHLSTNHRATCRVYFKVETNSSQSTNTNTYTWRVI